MSLLSHPLKSSTVECKIPQSAFVKNLGIRSFPNILKKKKCIPGSWIFPYMHLGKIAALFMEKRTGLKPSVTKNSLLDFDLDERVTSTR